MGGKGYDTGIQCWLFRWSFQRCRTVSRMVKEVICNLKMASWCNSFMDGLSRFKKKRKKAVETLIEWFASYIIWITRRFQMKLCWIVLENWKWIAPDTQSTFFLGLYLTEKLERNSQICCEIRWLLYFGSCGTTNTTRILNFLPLEIQVQPHRSLSRQASVQFLSQLFLFPGSVVFLAGYRRPGTFQVQQRHSP